MPISLRKIKIETGKKTKPESLTKDNTLDSSILPVYNLEGKKTEDFKLDTQVFDGKINRAILYQVIMMYHANQRRGTASTKTRGEVSGGGRKPWRQKGTGRARAGSIRSPLWRHGGVVFGPHPRNYSYDIPRKIRRLALKSSLNAKLKDNDVVLINEASLNLSKTRELINAFKFLKLTQGCLLVLDTKKVEILRASRNIPFLMIKSDKDINVYDVLKYKKLVLTKKALENLTALFKAR